MPVTATGEQVRTAILTVDDDPGVSRAVARDLRRRYGEEYRIVRAESGDAALDALRQMKLRGDLVAVMLADYRMPQMNGIEFLEQAMDIYPGARRALLTAYADTDAAIEAINVVDLDYYLLKPWDPPEEKLYPVVDALLEAWLAVRPPAGARDQGRRAPLVGALVRGARVPGPQPGALPLVLLRRAGRRSGCSPPRGADELRAAGGDHPGRRGAGRALGAGPGQPGGPGDRRRRPTSTTWSSSAAARRASAPRSTAPPRGCARCWSSGSATGGQAGQSSRIENYLGFPDGVSGAQLTDRARRQAPQVRRRDAHHPRGGRPGGRTARPGPSGSPTAPRSTPTR